MRLDQHLVFLLFAALAWPSAVALQASSLQASSSPVRRIERIESPTRLPVWPVVNGLCCTLLDAVGWKAAASFVEENFGGRVAPMSLNADPFVLLVHHRHAFSMLDPVRPLFRLLLPEGFPAHPHRGFETVTMTIKGGLRHRDSLGVKQDYKDGAVQWLTAGKGILHEEMWLGDQCELFQLWLNLPAAAKDATPETTVIHPKRDVHTKTPEIRLGGVLGDDTDEEEQRRPLSGPWRTDVRLSRIELENQGDEWQTTVPPEATVLLYCRRGAAEIDGQPLNQYALAYTERGASTVRLTATKPDTDLLFLCGLPLEEPVVSSGTWVVSSQAELAVADADYRAGRFGIPWDHALSDDEWKAHVDQYGPSF